MSDTIRQIDWKRMGVFTEGTDFNELLVVFVLATLGFTVFYYINKLVFPSLVRSVAGATSPFFDYDEREKDPSKREWKREKTHREYYSRNVADLHALIAAPLAIYACFNVCEDPDQNIFSNQQCLMTPTKAQLYLIVISTGYVTYDLFLCIFELGYSLRGFGGDFIMHHIVGIIGALAVLIAGRFNVALSAGNLVSEWTSFSMNMRWRFLKHKMADGNVYMVINAIFFFSYFGCRVIFMAALILRNVQIQQSFDIFSDPGLVSGAAVVSSVLQVALYLI